MYTCPYCLKNSNSLNRNKFPSWYNVAKHAKSCNKKTGEYYIDTNIGPIHYLDFINKSSDYLKYRFPNSKASYSYIRNHFNKFGYNIPNIETSFKKEELISIIQDFYLENDRIPTQREFTNSKNYPSPQPFKSNFESWNNAIEASGYVHNNSLYGIKNKALDGNFYRSLLETAFVNKFLYTKYKYQYENRYPNPYKYFYDFYITEKDLYIEIAGCTSNSYLNTIEHKRKINYLLNRQLLIVYNKDIINNNNLEVLISGKKTSCNCYSRSKN